jgi:DNA-binding transcriptional MerR regulator
MAPDGKLYYSIGEVCKLTDLKDSVLRHWESEIPKLRPKQNKSSGKRMYTKKDIELILHVKHLLHEEKLSVKDAKARIDEERKAGIEVKAAGRSTRSIPIVEIKDESIPEQGGLSEPNGESLSEPAAQTGLFDDHPASQSANILPISSPIPDNTLSEIRNELREILGILEP